MVKQNASPSAVRSIKRHGQSKNQGQKLERWQAARQAYEEFGLSSELISIIMGLKQRSVESRINKHQWQSLGGVDLCHEQQHLIKKLHQVVEAHFEHIEQLQGDEVFSEKKSRALNTLAATIEKLVKLNFQKNAGIGNRNEHSETEKMAKANPKTTQQFSPTETIEFREMLTKRIEAFINE